MVAVKDDVAAIRTQDVEEIAKKTNALNELKELYASQLRAGTSSHEKRPELEKDECPFYDTAWDEQLIICMPI
ncbi:MAG: hypothetical protein IJJ67_00910 [Oscillospiraceae bacterium]|nr:hypothetical protein [Oscillospiraceae bacterium]